MTYHRTVFNPSVDGEDDQDRHQRSNSGQWAIPQGYDPSAPSWAQQPVGPGQYSGGMGPGAGYPPTAYSHAHQSPSQYGHVPSYIDPRSTYINPPSAPGHMPSNYPQHGIPYSASPANQHPRISGHTNPTVNPNAIQPSAQWSSTPYYSPSHQTPRSRHNTTTPAPGGSSSGSRQDGNHSSGYSTMQIQLSESSPDDYSVESRPGDGKKCSHCHATTTPLWRRDPRTHKTLCNACGLYLYQRHQLRPQNLIAVDNENPEGADSDGDYDGPECSNCGTRKTSTWRRNKAGEQVCNACGVYERMNGKPRPLALRNDKIRPRVKH